MAEPVDLISDIFSPPVILGWQERPRDESPTPAEAPPVVDPLPLRSGTSPNRSQWEQECIVSKKAERYAETFES